MILIQDLKYTEYNNLEQFRFMTALEALWHAFRIRDLRITYAATLIAVHNGTQAYIIKSRYSTANKIISMAEFIQLTIDTMIRS